MSSAPYTNLESVIAELRTHARSGDWESAARLVHELNSLKLPKATLEDRSIIETAINSIAEIEEKAAYLKSDLARMLKAFDKPGKGP